MQTIPLTPPRPGARGYRVVFDRLTRYCLLEISVPAILAMLVIGFVGVANELRERRVALPLEYISGWDMARLVFYFSPTLIAYLVPIAFMMGILFAFGRLSQNNEITAMKAAGIPLKRLVMPVVIVGVLLSVGTFFLQDRVQPKAMERANQLLFDELPKRITLDVLPVGVMNEFAGLRIYFKGRDSEKRILRDIIVIEPKAGRSWIFYAESAQFVDSPEGTRLILRNGHQVIPQKGDSVMPILFPEREFKLTLLLRPPPAGHKAMTIAELVEQERKSTLQYASSKSKRNAENLRTVRNEISDRITLPFACLAIGLAAAPLAVRAPRSGRSYSFAIGIALIGGYYLLRILVEAKSVHPLEDYIVRGLVPNAVLGLIGLWALWRVDRV